MVIYDLAHVLMGLIDKFVLLAHKQTQLVPVLKLGLYILTGTQKMRKKKSYLPNLKNSALPILNQLLCLS